MTQFTEHSLVGLRGFVIVAIFALSMSTADSIMNSSSVLFSHDIYSVISKKKNEARTSALFIARLFVINIGIFSVLLAMYQGDVLSLIISTYVFYFTTITPIFFLTIFGFRTSSKCVIFGMIVGFIMTLVWQLIPMDIHDILKNIFGMFVAILSNIICLFGSHYMLDEPNGGWIGNNDPVYLE